VSTGQLPGNEADDLATVLLQSHRQAAAGVCPAAEVRQRNRRMKAVFPAFLLFAAAAAAPETFAPRVERHDPAFDRLIASDAKVETLADGIQWAEGPVWYQDSLVLSDPPRNIAWRWHPGAEKLEEFLNPSGGASPESGFREPGSNGLALDRQGRLLLCQDATRRVACYENGQFRPLADQFDGKRFSSPNDLAVRRNGEIYFTDPPYGLAGGNRSPLKEQPQNGVYRISADGKVTLLIKDLTFPNGIAFSPDEKVLYVNVSDGADTRIMAYDVQPDGTVANGRRFFDKGGIPEPKGSGGFDGLKVDRDGNLWTSGPGGISVVSSQGKFLGRIFTGIPTANCTWGPDGYLYITANHLLLRVKTRTSDGSR
jgi:gluconolactonase